MADRRCERPVVNLQYSDRYSVVVAIQGRNDFAIFVMTRELGILTWDEAFLSLRSTLLPDALRAKYCELIIGQYVGHVIGHLVSVSR